MKNTITITYKTVSYEVPVCMIKETSHTDADGKLFIYIIGRKQDQKLCFQLVGKYTEKQYDVFTEMLFHHKVTSVKADDMYLVKKQERWIVER